MHQPRNGKPACFRSLFFSEKYNPYNDPKKQKRPQLVWKRKKKQKRQYQKAGFPTVCTCGSNARLKIHIETRKMERGMVVLTLVVVTTYLMYSNRDMVVSLYGWRTGQCNGYRSSPRAFRTVSTKFHLHGERRILDLLFGLYAKMSAKKWHFRVFLDISPRSSRFLKMFGLACTLLCQGQRFQFSSPKLQWFSKFDF